MAKTARTGKGNTERVLIAEDNEAVNLQLWRLESSNRWTTGKLIITLEGGKLGNRIEVLWGNIMGKLTL